MNNLKTTPLIIAWLLWSLAGGFLYHTFCGTPGSPVADDIKDPLSLENDGIGSIDAGMSSFKDSDFQFSNLSKELSSRIDGYLKRLKKNPKENIEITALYGSHEKNTSIFPDLGLARANNIKMLFTQEGIPGDRIVINSKKVDDKSIEKYTSLEFKYLDEIKREGSLEDYKVLFEHEPITLYFKSKSDDLILSTDQREAFADLVSYMDLDPGIKVDIGGHTDNTGKRDSNIKLSKDRALKVRNILISNGMAPQRLTIKGYGSKRPIANNKTAEGRSQNRRVEISVQ